MPIESPRHPSHEVFTQATKKNFKDFWLRYSRGETPSSTQIHPDFLSALKPGFLALDVGCGYGSNTNQLRNAGVKVCALDINRNELLYGQDVNSSADYVQGEAENLPFRDASFDAITMLGLLGTVPKDRRELALQEALRVLKPEGLLYSSQFERVENDTTWEKTYKRDAAYLGEYGTIFIGWESGDVKFLDHHFSIDEILDLFESAQLKNIQLREAPIVSEVGGRKYNTLSVWGGKNEAPTGLRPGYLLPSLRREQNPSEAETY